MAGLMRWIPVDTGGYPRTPRRPLLEAEVAAQTGQRRLRVDLEGLAREQLVDLDIAARGLEADLVGQDRWGALAAKAVLDTVRATAAVSGCDEG